MANNYIQGTFDFVNGDYVPKLKQVGMVGREIIDRSNVEKFFVQVNALSGKFARIFCNGNDDFVNVPPVIPVEALSVGKEYKMSVRKIRLYDDIAGVVPFVASSSDLKIITYHSSTNENMIADDIYDIKVTASSGKTSAGIYLKGTTGKVVTIDYGNGATQSVTLSISGATIAYTYPAFGTYNINLYGATGDITEFNMSSGYANVEGEFISMSLPSKIINVVIFAISGMKFKGTLPSFNSCTKMYSFGCSSNLFSGELPSFSNLTHVNSIYISGNNFSGTLPSFNTCTNLGTFYCNDNNFSGELPSFNSCMGLSDFRCYNNKFSGSLPIFSNCVGLMLFQCQNNKFSGTLPSFSFAEQITTFFCNSNNFIGQLPSFNTCTLLSNFKCYDNLFSGQLPSFIDCTALQTLLISNNTDVLLNSFYDNSISTNIYNKTYKGISLYGQNVTGEAPSFKIRITASNLGVPVVDFKNCKFNSFLNMITTMYNGRLATSFPMIVDISGGSQPKPAGIYQAPVGYVQANTGVNGVDGTPASEQEMMYVLENQRVNGSATNKKYNFVFVTN